MKTEILGVPIDAIAPAEAVEILLRYLKDENNHIVITPNPEMVMAAQNDKDFMNILNKAELVIPDGIGIVIASKLNKVKIKERVTGCDLTQALFDRIKDSDYKVYLFGGKPGVCQLAAKKLEAKYKGLKIVGYHSGYFDVKEEKIIISEIQRLKPDILLVGLGFPKQEKWIYANKNKLPVKISIGVGGSIDVFAGTVKRAPEIYQKLGLEWFYRLMKQPSRIGRMLQLPVFIVTVFKSKLFNEK